MGPRPTIDMQCFLKSNSLSPPTAEQHRGPAFSNNYSVENAATVTGQYPTPASQIQHLNSLSSWNNNYMEDRDDVPRQYNDFPPQEQLLDDSHLFIVATDEDYQVIINLPGFRTEDVCVKIRNGNTLFLKGRQQSRQHNEERLTCGGFTDKGFRYTIGLPEDVSANDASACMENGKLIISCNKAKVKKEQTQSWENVFKREQYLTKPKMKKTNKISIDVREFRKDGQVIVKFIGKRHLVVEGEAMNKSKEHVKISRHFHLPKDVDLRTLESVRIKSSDGFMVLHIPTGKPKLDILEVTIPISNNKNCRSKICGRVKNLRRTNSKTFYRPESISCDGDSDSESVVTIIPIKNQEDGIFYRATVVSQPWTGWTNDVYTNDKDRFPWGSDDILENNQYNNPSLYSYDTNSFSEITLLSKKYSFLTNLKQNMHDNSTSIYNRDSSSSLSRVHPLLIKLSSSSSKNDNCSSRMSNINLRPDQNSDNNFDSSHINNIIKDLQPYQYCDNEVCSSPMNHKYNDLQPYQFGDNETVSPTETFTTQCLNGSFAAVPRRLLSELERPNKRQKMEITPKSSISSNGFVTSIISLKDNLTTPAVPISINTEINDEPRPTVNNNHMNTSPQGNRRFTTQSTIFINREKKSAEICQTSSNILSIVMNSINTNKS